MPRSRLQLPSDLAGMLTSEWEHLISEANLGAEDTMIARLYILDKLPQIEVAEELGINRSTVSRRMPQILLRIRMIRDRTRAGA